MGTALAPRIDVAGRSLQATPAFASYWRVAAERQRIFFRRAGGEPPPWTDDPVLRAHRFTNAYRASDRVSQYLINEVIYGTTVDARSMVLRVLLFKVFNRPATWRVIEEAVGELTMDTFDVKLLDEVLTRRISTGKRLYSAAYIMPSPRLGSERKHSNHLHLLRQLSADGTIDELLTSTSLRALFERLSRVPSFGPFLAFQFAIDLNYTPLFPFSEMDYVVAGPGARDGISKCFTNAGDLPPSDVIRAVTESADEQFEAAGIQFESLWGRPLQLIDCQNLFCEVSKYARVAHPELVGVSGRTRIKQRYVTDVHPFAIGYPPKWGLPMSALGPCQRLERESASVQVANNATAVRRSHLPPHLEPLEDCSFNLPKRSTAHL